MKNIKRVLAVMLALVMVLGLMPMSIFAENELPTKTFYVASSANKGSDVKNDGETEGAPFLTIGKAIEMAGDDNNVEIKVLGELEVSQPMEFRTGRKATLDLSGGSISVKPANPIGFGSAGLKVTNGTELVITGGSVSRPAGNAMQAGLVYVADGSQVVLGEGATLRNGMRSVANANDGGSAVHVGNGGTFTMLDKSAVTDNESNGVNASGAIFVENGGSAVISGGTVSGNRITSSGTAVADRANQKYSGIYVQKGGHLTVNGEADTDIKDGVYVEVGADAKVGAVGTGAASVNIRMDYVFLACEATANGGKATLDIIGPTQDSEITIETADGDHEPYRLVSRAVDYDIDALADGDGMDEVGWNDGDKVRDIRYMDLDGVPGLYYYYHTLDAEFINVGTLTGISGEDIRGQDVTYYDDVDNMMPAQNVREEDYVKDGKKGTMVVVPEVIAVDDGDFTFRFTTDEAGKDHRIPELSQVKVDYVPAGGGASTSLKDFIVYEPDFAAGTATLTVPADALRGLGRGTVRFNISGEKYRHLTLHMHGPLYTMEETGVTHVAQLDAMSVAGPVFSSDLTEATYTVTRAGMPMDGVLVKVFAEGDDARELDRKPTGPDGKVTFTGLPGTRYIRYTLDYSDSYDVVERDVVTVNLSATRGEKLRPNLDAEDVKVPENFAGVNYSTTDGENWGTATAKLTGIQKANTVNFYTDTGTNNVVFDGNPDNYGTMTMPSTWKTMTFEMGGNKTVGTSYTKEMNVAAETYGEMPTVSMVGYDVSIWHRDQTFADSEKFTSASEYDINDDGKSPKTLFAVWTPRTDIHYGVSHWVELSPDKMDGEQPAHGVNPGYVAGTTPTKTYEGRTYYLYQEAVPQNDGVADRELKVGVAGGLSSKAMTSMEDEAHSWWTIDGLTPKVANDNPVVLADGSSVFDIYYDRNEYILSYEPAPGRMTMGVNTQTMKFGDAVGSMLVAERPGYSFGGWYTGVGTGESVVTATSWYTWTDNAEVHAKWTSADTTYAIAVMVQDADTTVSPNVLKDIYARQKFVTKPAGSTGRLGATSGVETTVSVTDTLFGDQLAINGFTYKGYAVGTVVGPVGDMVASDDGTFTFAATEFGADKYGVGDMGLSADTRQTMVYLYYGRNIGHVDFMADDTGDGVHGEVDIVYGDKFKLPDDPTKLGYDFIGWVDKDGNPVTGDTVIDGYVLDGSKDVVIRPVWDARSYYLTYVPGDNVQFIPGTVSSDGYAANPSVPGGYVSNKAVVYDQPVGDMPAAAKTGHTFDGWFVDGTGITSGTVVSVDNVVIKNDGNTYEATRPLHAGFTPFTNVLVLDHDGGTSDVESIEVTYGKPVSGLPVPEREGYTFVSWVVDTESVGKTAVANGDTWTLAMGPDVEYHAKATWVANPYKYGLNLNDVSEGNGSTRAYLRDVSISGPVVDFDKPYEYVLQNIVADRNGYDFLGWSLSKDLGDMVTKADLNRIPEDSVLYAMWRPKAYTMRVDPKAPAGEWTVANADHWSWNAYANEHYEAYNTAYGTDVKVVENDDGTIDVPVIFDTVYGPIGPIAREHYVLKGWEISAAGWPMEETTGIERPHGTMRYELDMPYVDSLDQSITADAVWDPVFDFIIDGNKYPGATFDDGTTGTKSVRRDELAELGSLYDAMLEDYKFLGWYDSEGDRVDFESVIAMDGYEAFEARFSPMITFDGNGGKVAYENTWHDRVSVSLADLVSFPGRFPDVVHDGKTFCGWVSDDGTDMGSFSNLVTRTTPVTLTATWDLTVQFVLPPNATWADGSRDVIVRPISEVATWDSLEGRLTAKLPGRTFVGWYYVGVGETPTKATPATVAKATRSISVQATFGIMPGSLINVNEIIYGDGISVDRTEWAAGTNEFTVLCDDACAVALFHGDGKTELVGKRLVDGGCVFEADLADGDAIMVVRRGDVDLNGRVNSIDATCVLRSGIGHYDLTYEKLIAGDMNLDDKVSSVDATCILRYGISHYDIKWRVNK